MHIPDLQVGSPDPNRVRIPWRKLIFLASLFLLPLPLPLLFSFSSSPSSSPDVCSSGVAPHLIGFGSSLMSFDQSARPNVRGNDDDADVVVVDPLPLFASSCAPPPLPPPHGRNGLLVPHAPGLVL
jgi:hypothetical protein